MIGILKKIPAVLFLFVFSSSFAAAFDGLSIHLGLGGSHSKTVLRGDNRLANNTVISLNGSSSSANSFNGIAAVSYSKNLKALRSLNIAAKFFYIVAGQAAGSGADTNNNGRFILNRSYRSSLQNTFGISIEPGWNFSNSTLVYLDLAWVHSTYNIPNSYTVDAIRENFLLQAGINGLGYGVGVKQLLTKHIFAAFEFLGIYYPTQKIGSSTVPNTLSADADQFTYFVSLGYLW